MKNNLFSLSFSVFLSVSLLSACDEPSASEPESKGAQSKGPRLDEVAKVQASKTPEDEATQVALVPRVKTPSPAVDLGKSEAGLGIEVGAKIPEAGALNMKGERITLQELSADGPILLIFYRGGWCPYCNFQVRGISRNIAEFQKRAVTPVLVSVDQVSESVKTLATYKIQFPVLSDSKLELHQAFSVLNKVSDADIKKMKDKGHDLEAASARLHRFVAYPSVFLLDKGKIVFSHVDKDFRARPTVKQLTDKLEELGYAASEQTPSAQ